MKKIIKKIIFNKLYMGCLAVVFMQYVIRNNYIKQALFNTTNISTILAGTILFSSLYIFILVLKKFTLPTWKKLFNMLKK